MLLTFRRGCAVPTALAIACLVVACGTSTLLAQGDGGDAGPPPCELCIPEPDGCTGATATLTAIPSSVALGQATALSWSVHLPSGCSNELALDSTPVVASGNQILTPFYTAPHRINLGTETLAVTNVTVVLPATVLIDGNTEDWRVLFVQAVGTPNTRVVLTSNVDMDLTGWEDIEVAGGVTITSEAPRPAKLPFATTSADLLTRDLPPQRNARELGPRLFTRGRPRPLFHLRCYEPGAVADNVRFVGFRIQGPHEGTEVGDDNLERGIQIDACLGVEIADMEISGWSGQSVYIQDNARDANNVAAPRQHTFDAVRVHDSFIHNNQHAGGNGYGVVIGPGGHATFEHNVFDFNRHAIASSGVPRSSYRARENLILKGGGVHDQWYKHFTHMVDVHGDANCGVWSLLADSLWNCGNAGDRHEIIDNAFQFTSDLSIHIRGTPRTLATISGNVFAQSDIDEAIETYGSRHIALLFNTFGVETFGEYGVCDLDGDGKDDFFLPTGTSWWYMSAAKMHWVFLASRRERRHQLGLGDFDGDGRCDVFSVNASNDTWEIASGGRGSTLVLPGSYPLIPIDQLRFGDFNGDHVTDVFRRAPDGQWSAISPGRYGWTSLQSSSLSLTELRFGDLDGDGVTDVLGGFDGHLWVSWSARSTWAPAGAGLPGDVRNLYIADVDGLPGDDLIRYIPTNPTTGRWDISSGGRTRWQTLATYTGSVRPTITMPWPSASVRTFLGRFDAWANADVLAIDGARIGRLFSAGHSNFARHGLYAY